MARIIPSDISPLALAGAHSRELETLALLKDQLGPDYAVFHSVHWSFSQGQATRFGEIDFILVNRAGNVLCIEQKNGALAETPDGLVKVYGERHKSVGTQIHRSLNQVRDKYQWQHPQARSLTLDYLLYCPDYRVRNLNAAGLDQNRIVDAAASDGLARRIARVLGPGEPDPARRALIEAFFRQTFEVVPQIHRYRQAQEQHYVRHGGALAELIRTLEMSPFRVRVSGTAGCGKSLLASVFARDQAAQGRRVLMVCFNRPLADRLQTLIPEVRAQTFYGFCDQFLRGRGETLDYDRMNQPGFWSAIQDRVLAAPIPQDWRFDTLIVDEGQDFAADWLEILHLGVDARQQGCGTDVGGLSRCEFTTGAVAERFDQGMNLRGQATARAADGLGAISFWAPAACWCTRITVESRNTSSTSASVAHSLKTLSHTPLFCQRAKPRYTLFQGAKSSGRSRHGAPERAIQSTASTNRRLSAAVRPRSPGLPGSRWKIRSHWSSRRLKRGIGHSLSECCVNYIL